MKQSLYTSAYYSLFVQFIIGIICLCGIFLEIDNNDKILNEILILETIVQGIEFVFYIWLVFNFSNINTDISLIRYIDWFITTPTMLFSLICFMIYYNNKNNNIPTNSLTMRDIYNNNFYTINNIIIFNAIMLISGLLGEFDIITKYISCFIGSIFLSLSFYLIYINFVGTHLLNNILFWFNYNLWSLYGIAYLLSFNYKNITYNILDVFAKNFNGLLILGYICFILFQKNNVS
tara:strand:- start:1391 stop:2092 length:702 start_codon:yes stop_codon:yes gene_type:complete